MSRNSEQLTIGRRDGLRRAIGVATMLATKAEGDGAEQRGQRRMAERIIAELSREVESTYDPLCQLRAGDLGLSGATRQPDGSVGG